MSSRQLWRWRWGIALAALLGASVVGTVCWAPEDEPIQGSPTPSSSVFHPVEVFSVGQSALALTGQVLDAQGRPLEGAVVSLAASSELNVAILRCAECGEPLLSCPAASSAREIGNHFRQGVGALRPASSTRSDREGRFRFEGLVGAAFTVWASATGFGVAGEERVAPGVPVTVRLGPARTLRGMLVDKGGRSVAGKVVALSRRFPLPQAASARGAFEISGLGDGPWSLWAEAEGFVPLVMPNVSLGAEPVRVVLERARSLEVWVTRQGAPVEARVHLLGDHLDREQVAGQGRASFGDLPPDSLTVSAHREGWAASQGVELTEDHSVVRLELEPGGWLEITVVGSDGQPVAEASLVVRDERGEEVGRGKARVGEVVRLGPLSRGDYLVLAQAKGFLAREEAARVGPTPARVDLVLERAIRLSGRVLDEYDRPAEGVPVFLQPIGEHVVTDAQGGFEAEVPSPGLYELSAHHSDWGGASLQATAPAEGLELRLDPKASVEVAVEHDGRRVEGAEVAMSLAQEGQSGGYRSDRRSGVDGRVQVRGLPAGSYWMVALHPEYLPSQRQRIHLTEGQLHRAVARLQQSAWVSGWVIDEQGRSISEAIVRVLPGGVTSPPTDEGGAFRLGPLRPLGRYRLSATHADYDDAGELSVQAPSEQAKLVLTRRPRFRGRVLGGDGRPVARYRVDDQEVEVADGRFELPLRVEDERIRFQVVAAGFETTSVERSAAQRDVGDIAMKAAPSLSGRVVDEQGHPVVGAEVRCSVCDDIDISGADGHFSLARPRPGTDLQLEGRRGEESGVLALKAGEERPPLLLVLRRKVRMVGRAYGASGQPAPGAGLEVMPTGERETASVVTDSTGAFELSVAPGMVRLLWERMQPSARLTIFLAELLTDRQLTLGPAPNTFQLLLHTAPRPGFALLLLRAGEPLEGQILIQPKEADVVVQGLSAGSYWVTFGPAPLLVEAGKNPRDFLARPPAGIVGRTVEVPAQIQLDLR